MSAYTLVRALLHIADSVLYVKVARDVVRDGADTLEKMDKLIDELKEENADLRFKLAALERRVL